MTPKGHTLACLALIGMAAAGCEQLKELDQELNGGTPSSPAQSAASTPQAADTPVAQPTGTLFGSEEDRQRTQQEVLDRYCYRGLGYGAGGTHACYVQPQVGQSHRLKGSLYR